MSASYHRVRKVTPLDIKLGALLIPNKHFAETYPSAMRHSQSKPFKIISLNFNKGTIQSADGSYNLTADFKWALMFDVVDDSPEKAETPVINPVEGDLAVLKNDIAVGGEVRSTNINRTVFNTGDLFNVFEASERSVVLVSKHTNEVLRVTREHFMMSFEIIAEPKDVKLDVPTTLHQYLLNSLEEAEKRGSLVEVGDLHRGIGKTTALVAYAKLTDRTLVVGNEVMKKYLSVEHKTGNVVTLKEVLIGKHLSGKTVELIVDECVDAKQLRGMRYFKVVTGFKKTN